ncbi:MAG: hypothetical protein IJN38_08125 [Clostridia bacterium]|nr:hypothetical protein [Clostridia bacterium]
MKLPEKWIWLSKEKYPENQTTINTVLGNESEVNYTVAEFFREYKFAKKATKIDLRFSGDTYFELYLNGKIAATGPVPIGTDFIGNNFQRGQHYASEASFDLNGETVAFFARVKMGPVGIYEYSQGTGGFMLGAYVTFEDGTKTVISTDESWLARLNPAYTGRYSFDSGKKPDEYSFAELSQNIRHAQTAPLPLLSEEKILPDCREITVGANETKTVCVEFEKIYAAYLNIAAKAQGEVKITVTDYETQVDSRSRKAEITFDGSGEYRSLQVHSVGGLQLEITNNSDREAVIHPAVIAVNYPVTVQAKTRTSDKDLNLVLDVCAHTLKICRQHIHLDSPCHYEPLACTGDYYIESLMTAFSYGDMRLAEFDVIRTAELLRNNDGRMFHTTYSLIWVMMLYDTYMLGGNIKMLCECLDALIMLLDRFAAYVDDNGIIETPPDYMFIDWLYIDEISLHHPPKALGQTCLNMFYYGALTTAVKIFDILGEGAMAAECTKKAESLKNAVNTLLFDEEKQMYFEGLNTPTPEHLLNKWMPQNTAKRYYRKHANILAAYVGICDKALAKSLLHRIMSDEIEGEYQAYFAHYLFEALYRNDLRNEYTLTVAQRWKQPVKDCTKGLAEGFIPPEPSYSFDHSHAWGGTPLYSVPKALTGLEILEASYRKISLSPSLLGLDKATTEIPTPYGLITVTQRDGKTEYDIPEGIEAEVK